MEGTPVGPRVSPSVMNPITGEHLAYTLWRDSRRVNEVLSRRLAAVPAADVEVARDAAPRAD